MTEMRMIGKATKCKRWRTEGRFTIEISDQSHQNMSLDRADCKPMIGLRGTASGMAHCRDE